jgi:maleylpyruvate isomerase
MEPVAHVDACHKSHRRLLSDLASLTNDDFCLPSLLPRYSRGHVITHLTNKTKAHILLFGGPAAGEIRKLHPDGYDPDMAADAGASRPGVDLVSDLEISFEFLEAAWDALDDNMWDRLGIMTAGPRTMAEIITHHLRDVEVHHVDLDIGYLVSSWPPILVDGELAKRLRALPNRTNPADLLAWLLGRAAAPELLGPW